MVWNVDNPGFPEPPTDDDPPVLEERGDEYQPSRDEDTGKRWREDFPHRAGRGLRRELTMFESQRKIQVTSGESIWGSFSGEGDWALAQWIIDSGTTCANTNELLKLEKVSRTFVVKHRTYYRIADSKCRWHLIPQ